MTQNLFDIQDPADCYCDVIGYERTLFNLKLRAYTEPAPGRRSVYRYYLFDFFYTIYYSGPTFWQGMHARRGTDGEIAQLAPYAMDRKTQMLGEGRVHYPRLYRFENTDIGPIDIIAGVARIYVHESVEPLSINADDGRWLADWPITFEEGLPGLEEFGR